jgi:hypothetical protein
MAINLTGGLPPEILGQQQQLNRQQQMAQMLMQQGQQMPQGQMISGRYVAPSIFASLAPLAQMYAGQKMLERGDQKALDLAKQLREGQGAALADYMGQLQGRPAVPDQVTQMAGPYGQGVGQGGADIPMPTAVIEGKPAVQGNRLLASMNALQNPYTPDFLRQQAIKSLTPEAFTIKEGEKRIIENPDGTFREIASGGEKQSPEYKNYLIAKNDPINPFKGGFTDYQTMLKKAGASNVSVNTANKFAGGFADKASAGAYNMYESALAAPQQIENAKRTIELVNSGALTGPTADVALTAAKIFNVAGANNQETISKTEQLFSNRGKAMLGSIKQSGLAGSQGLTEGERKFLTQAEGGTIALNAETLKALAGLEIKLAVANQKKWNAQAGKMDKEVLSATGAGPVEVYTGIGTIDTSNPLLNPRR